jgi:hypothetical protein
MGNPDQYLVNKYSFYVTGQVPTAPRLKRQAKFVKYRQYPSDGSKVCGHTHAQGLHNILNKFCSLNRKR